MNGERTLLVNSISGLKDKKKQLEKKIDDIVNRAEKGGGDLKHIRALAEVLNLIKDEYVIEENRVKNMTQSTSDKPVGKIVAYFTKQLYLNLYIVYSIKYINTINFQFTPEFRDKFIQNAQKVREIEIVRMNDPNISEAQKKKQERELERIGEGIQFPSARRNEAGLDFFNPISNPPPNPIPNPNKTDPLTDFGKKERIAIIIDMLKTYDIPYDKDANEKKLLQSLKDGFALITDFIIESINSGPKNLEMLKSLQNVRGELTN